MRLINADYLKSILNGGGTGESVNINISKRMPLSDIVDTVIFAYKKCLLAELEKVPTAYDVSKVLERLEKMKLKREEQLRICADNDMADYLRCKMSAIAEAIEIVKSGSIR